MEIFKQLNKKGYKHYYEGTIEELDSMNKDNQHLHSEIMQIIMWLYEKHGIWISVIHQHNKFFWKFGSYQTQEFNSPTEAYEAAIDYVLNNLI